MASPLSMAAGILSLSPQYHCSENFYGDLNSEEGQGPLKPALGEFCDKQAAPLFRASGPCSCSDVASFDSEVRAVESCAVYAARKSRRAFTYWQNETSSIWQPSSNLKCDEDVCCAASGSSVGMLHCEDALDDDDDDEDATREWAPGRPATMVASHTYHHADAEETLR
jgi:hypothetical protein